VNHRYIEESNIADYYLLGKLPPEEQARFEEHFVDCQECLERLETTGKFRRALKTVVAEDAARSSAYVQVGLLAWLIRRSRWQQASLLLTAILFLAALPTVFFVTKIRRMQGELEQAKKASSDWQRQYEEQQRAANGLEKELQEARANLIEQRHQPEVQPERESQSLPVEAGEANRATRPQVGVPVFALSIVRSADPGASEPANRISIPRSTRSIVLSLELENGAEVQSFRATISTAGQRVIWNSSNLKPHSKDTLRIKLDSDLIKAGDYQLTLEGLTREGRYVPEGKYGFRVIKTE
jgi:hypothetical protein